MQKVEFLTDRLGEYELEAVGVNVAQKIEQLRPMMFDELSFIVNVDGVLGIMIERELDGGDEPSAEEVSWWQSLEPEGCKFRVYKGDINRPTFADRWVFWGFFPEGVVTAECVEKYGTILFDGLEKNSSEAEYPEVTGREN